MKLSIRLKLLFLMLITYLAIFAMIIYIPTHFYSDYYRWQKQNSVTKEVVSFGTNHLKNQFSDVNPVITDVIADWSQGDHLYVEVFKTQNLVSVFGPTYQMQLATKDEGIFNIHFDKYTLYDDNFDQFIASPINTTIIGYRIGHQTIFPISFNGYRLDTPTSKYYEYQFKPENLVSLNGELIGLTYPTKTEGVIYQSTIAENILRKGINGIASDKDPGVVFYEYLDTDTGIEHHMVTYTLNPYIVTALYSITPKADEDFYRFKFLQMIALIGLIIVFIVSLWLSRIITKPILTLNQVAKKMSDLDFSQKLTTKNHDEIQTLASSLNALSTKLERHIHELNHANNLLSFELEKERTLEDLRKQFIADSSHELKTPLGVIRAYSERIQDQLLKTEFNKNHMLECTGILLDEVRHIDNLIIKLNTLSKIESPMYGLNYQHIVFTPIIESQLNRLEYMIDDKNLKMEVTINHDTPILADESNMKTVLENLITNAVHYAPDDSTITIYYNGVFRISNNCPELSDYDLQHLWDRFYRVDPSRSRHLGGSGLGLAIVKSILDKHGFDFDVTYSLGRIEFYFDVIHPRPSSNTHLSNHL